jgi:hypothetical protein
VARAGGLVDPRFSDDAEVTDASLHRVQLMLGAVSHKKGDPDHADRN